MAGVLACFLLRKSFSAGDFLAIDQQGYDKYLAGAFVLFADGLIGHQLALALEMGARLEDIEDAWFPQVVI